jgi:hypothetical protein
MRGKLLLGVCIAVVAMVLSAWSPWLTQSFAEVRAVDSFNKSWSTVIDGCGTNCKGCGVIHSKRVPFGMEITLEYGCGLMPEDTPEYHEQAAGFVSTFGTVHGFPKP